MYWRNAVQCNAALMSFLKILIARGNHTSQSFLMQTPALRQLNSPHNHSIKVAINLGKYKTAKSAQFAVKRDT